MCDRLPQPFALLGRPAPADVGLHHHDRLRAPVGPEAQHAVLTEIPERDRHAFGVGLHHAGVQAREAPGDLGAVGGAGREREVEVQVGHAPTLRRPRRPL